MQRLIKREITTAEGAVGTTLETLEYDGLSRVNYAADNDSQLNFQYDRASRLDWEKRSGKLIDYTYDRLSNLRNIQYPNSRLIDREFDQLNRMNLIKEGEITIADMMHIGRSYRLLRKQYGNGDLINYLYDQGRRLTNKETKNKNSELINHYAMGYNKVHMKTYEQRLHDNGKGNVMAYDDLYRLTNMKFNVPDPTVENPTSFEKEKTIKFDKLDNILSIVENFNGQTKTITTDIPENSVYSKLNQYASFDQWGLDYDKKGNTTQKGTQQLSYDYRNQLVTAVDAPSNTQVDMKYDVLGRRIQKSVTIGSQTKIENYYHSGQQVIEVRDGNDQLLRQYIYGNGIDEIIRMDKYEGNTFTSYYYHTDANGSVTAITDADGNLVERVTYGIYGMPTFWDATGNVISKSSIGNNILFHGREYDYELNLYYFRARYYCPIMGRFLSTDPMGYADSMNLYQGFNMNPVNFVDQMGQWTQEIHKKISRNALKSKMGILKPLMNGYMNVFKIGLEAGSIWPDMPEGPIGAVWNAFDIDVDLKSGLFPYEIDFVEQNNPNRKSLTWRSHFGDLQYWHGMSYRNQSKKMTRHLIIRDVSKWIRLARGFLNDDSKKYSKFERYLLSGRFVGMALHVVEDTYCPGHTERDKETFKIKKFYDYSMQYKKWHKERDYISKYTEYYYVEAEKIAAQILKLLSQTEKNLFEMELKILLEDILSLNQ